MASRDDSNGLKAFFRMKGYFEAMPRAWERAGIGAASEEEAATALLDAMGSARRPTLAEVEHFAAGLNQYGLLGSLSVVFAVLRWYPDERSAQGLGLIAVMWAVSGADSDPHRTVALRHHTFLLGLRLADSMPSNDAAILAHRELTHQLGSSLAPDDDPVKAAQGRRLLRLHVSDTRIAINAAESAGVGGKRLFVLRLDLARGLANLGQALETWSERHDCDDPQARLEEALVLQEEAFTFPERVGPAADPTGLYHSLKMRGICRRHLARYVIDDPARRIALLDGAVDDARAAYNLARRFPGRFRGGDAIAVNVVNAVTNRVGVRFELGLVAADEAAAELDAVAPLAEEVRRSPDPRAPVLAAAMETGLRSVRALLSGRPARTTPDALERSIRAALFTLRDSRAKCIEPAAARSVIQDIESLGDAVLPGRVMHLLSGFFGYIDVAVIGPELAARAIARESVILAKETGRVRDGWDPIKHVEDGLRGYALRLCDWSMSVADRRVAAGWMRALVRARLAWAFTGVRPVGILEEVRLADLHGSVAWRSDLSFFGQGPWRAVPGPMRNHEDWRCYILRTRWELDSEAEFLHARAMREMMTRLTGVRVDHKPFEGFGGGKSTIYPVGTSRDRIRSESDVPEALWLTTPDGIVVPCRITEASARAASTRLVGELREAWGVGVGRGWAPAEVPDLPQANADELGLWLAANRDTAVLIADGGLSLGVVGHDGSTVWVERAEGTVALGRVIEEYEEARDAHSFGSAELAPWVMAPDITDAERERRHRSAIATPDATASLDRAIIRLLYGVGVVFGPALTRAAARGARRLLILGRGWARHMPWQAVPIDGATLGDTFAAALVETLGSVATAKPRTGGSALYVGGEAGPGSSLALGKAVLAPLSSIVAGPTSRDDFEALAAKAKVLRVFGHGTPMLLKTDTGGIEMNEDDRRPVNRYTVSEARTLDLRGARRVELWACESGRGDALYVDFLHHDEPGGMDAAVLLAGAECVVASLWTQYVLSSAMIAEAFTLALAGRPQAEAEALGAAVRRYRDGMAHEGVFASAVNGYLAACHGAIRVESALRAGLDAWRQEAWTDLLGRDAPPIPEVALDGLRLGPSHRSNRSLTGAEADVDQLLAPYRSPLAWAGWRVSLRCKEVFEPPRGDMSQ